MASRSVPPYSFVVGNSSVNDAKSGGKRGPIRRSANAELIGQTALHGCLTLHETFHRSVSLHPNRPCLGERVIDSAGNPGPYVFQTYSQCDNRIKSLASGLIHENLLGRNDQGMQLLGVYMKNCSAWVLAEYACYAISAATVPLYDTLGEDTVSYVINHTRMQTCLCSSLELPRLCEVASKCPSLQTILLKGGSITNRELAMCRKVKLNVMTFDELAKVGDAFPHEYVVPNDDSLATFCYTSGTTGDPKGALITHRNIVSVAASALNSCFDIRYDDYYLSFLPLPHIFERMVVSALLSCGSAIGFFRGDPLKLIEDCIALRPSIFCAVPRVLNKIHDKIESGMVSTPGAKGYMFQLAMNAKLHSLKKSGILKHTLWDAIIFSKIKSALGLDRVRQLVSGGAPLSVATMNFLRVLFGSQATIHEGYGLTESTGGISLTSPYDLSPAGHVGGPLPVVDVCLADVPDMEYFHSDSVHGDFRCDGRGEILVRGPGIFKGYYKDENATKEALTSDGWLRTGDIGLWRPDGQLSIVDRKKNLLKLSQGEYVAVEKIENILGRASSVNQIFVHGVSTEDCVVCVVVPDVDIWQKWLSAQNGKNSDGSLKFAAVVLEELTELGNKNGLKGFEIVKGVHIDAKVKEWGPHNGFTTPTQKLKRRALQDVYKNDLEKLYSEIKSFKKKRLNMTLSKI